IAYDGIVSFFFQAEDGIRDRNVTGVQTCALPISIICDPDTAGQMMLLLLHGKEILQSLCQTHFGLIHYSGASKPEVIHNLSLLRSEERRVGKECRSSV